MTKNKLGIVTAIAIVAIVGIIFSIAPFAAAPQDDKQVSLDLPNEVKEAIKNKLDYVEIRKTPRTSDIYWIDYARPASVTPSGTDCGQDSSSYTTWYNFKWFSFPVNYQIDASGVAGVDPIQVKQAVVNAFNTWDSEEHPAGNLFTEASPANVDIRWANIDGYGNVLATTRLVNVDTTTGQLSYVTVTYDSGDSWKVYGSLSCNSQGSAFDIEEVGTHEIGHVIGLGHTNRGLKNYYLTMYPFAGQGETLRRTLGTGDKKGIAAIYR